MAIPIWGDMFERKWPNTGPPGLVPRRMPTAPYQGMEPTATMNVADSAWDTTHTPMAGKKGLSLKNMINAMSKMKTPQGGEPGSIPGRVGSNPLAKFSPMPGLNPNYDWSYGGLDFDPLKRQKKMMGSLV